MFIDVRLTIDCINCIQASKFWILNFYLKSLIMRWQIKKSIDDNMGFPMKILENKIDSEGWVLFGYRAGEMEEYRMIILI